MKSEDIVKIENIKSQNIFIINWNMTYLCNYYCDFCIQGNKERHIEMSKKESIETRKKICDNMIKFIETQINKRYKILEIYLIGGEVTILKDFLEIVQKIVDCKFKGLIRIHITTNLSIDKNTLKKLVKIFSKNRYYKRKMSLSATYYKEFTSEEEFVSKLKILSEENTILGKIKKYIKKEKNIHMYVNYPLCTDKDYEEYMIFKEKYKRLVKRIGFIIIKKYKTSISELTKKKLFENERKIYKNSKKTIKVTFKNDEVYYFNDNNKISLKLDNEMSFNPNGYLCDAGIYSIFISNLGIVSRCTSCKEQTIIGNIKEGIINMPVEKMICPANSCGCSYYRIIERKEQ